MGRRSWTRSELRLRALLVGVAVTFGTYPPVAGVYVLVFRDRIHGLGAVTVVAAVLLLVPPLFGGAVACHMSAARRGQGALHGWAAGFVPGFVIGYGLLLLFVVGTRVEPAPTYTAVESVLRLVIAPTVVGVVVGLFLSVGSTIGALIGYEVRRRRIIGGRRRRARWGP